MVLPTLRLTRAVGLTVAFATVAAGCGNLASRPDLVEVSQAPAPAEILAFVEPEDADPVPENHAPELLGLDDARAAASGAVAAFDLGRLGETASNPLIAAEVRAERSGIPGPTEATTSAIAVTGDVGAVAADGATPEQQLAGTDGDAPAPADVDVDWSSSSETTEAVEVVVDGPALPRPDVPVRLPRYTDPSPALIQAAARPFDLLGPSGGASTSGVTADIIRVSGLVSQSLVGFPFRPDVCAGAAARFASANQQSELTRKIAFDQCYDDAGRIDLADGLAATLVRDEVFAVVPVASPAFAGAATLTEAGVPYFGGTDLPAFCGRGNPLGFGTWGAQSCPVLAARGYVSLAEPVLAAYASTWGDDDEPSMVYAVETGPKGDAIAGARAFEAELLGIERPTFLALLPSSSQGPRSDWTDVAVALSADDPAVILLEGVATEGLPAALRDHGFDGDVVLVARMDPLDVADTAKRLELAPLTVITPGLDLATRSSAGWDALVGAAAAVGFTPELIGLDFVEGYLAADVFVQAVAATPEPLTVERFADAINDGWWYPGVDGVSCGSWWPAAHLAAVPCVSISKVEVFNDELVPVLGLVETEPQLRFDLS